MPLQTLTGGEGVAADLAGEVYKPLVFLPMTLQREPPDEATSAVLTSKWSLT